MSAKEMAAQCLSAEIIEALRSDEKSGGYDLESGLFGPAFSRIVRRLAAAELQLLAKGAPE